MITQGEFGAFILGIVATRIYLVAKSYWMMWRLERQFIAAKKRCDGCRHEQVIKVNVSSPENPVMTNKCLDCWALQIGTVAGDWSPNSASPEEAARNK